MKDKLARGEKWAQQVGIDTAQWESTTPLESIKQVIEPVFKNTDLIAQHGPCKSFVKSELGSGC